MLSIARFGPWLVYDYSLDMKKRFNNANDNDNNGASPGAA